MPIGIIVNLTAVVIGGLTGAAVGGRLTEYLSTNLTMIFGLASMGMGISAIVLMENMPAVILATILGTAIGLVFHMGDWIRAAAGTAQKLLGSTAVTRQQSELLVTAIVLFCASGTGIYGAIISGMNGDHSILIAKAILDFCSALIFGCVLGKTVSLIAIPQGMIMLALFVLAGVIFPMTTPAMVNDFKACGGFIMLATGFRIVQMKMFPTADMIPAMVLVMPLSYLWSNYILPLVAG